MTVAILAVVVWLLIGAIVANFTWPRWIGLPFWWVVIVWPLTFRRSP